MQAFHFDTIDSTNEAAKRLFREGKLRESSYLVAREQTAGKGNRGRRWLSPRDAGIYLTVVHLAPSVGASATSSYTLAAGVACVEALAEAAAVAVHLKPINDLYVAGRKLGGILTETVIQNAMVEALVTGVGINVAHAERVLLPNAVPAVCLQELLPAETFQTLNLNQLVAVLVCKIGLWHAAVSAGKISAVRRAWESHKVHGTVLPSS